MAGIFVQTIAFAMPGTGVLLANDLQKGLIDRFRSLPMNASDSAGRAHPDRPLAGHVGGHDHDRVGLGVGFRPDGDLGGWAGAIGILLLFGFALAWIGVLLGMLVRTPEAAKGAMFIFVLPLTFASSAFVPTDTMPKVLRAFTEHQPITLVINTVRAWMLGQFGWLRGLAVARLVGRDPGCLLPARHRHLPQAHHRLVGSR